MKYSGNSPSDKAFWNMFLVEKPEKKFSAEALGGEA
jgi:hypothetical protein